MGVDFNDAANKARARDAKRNGNASTDLVVQDEQTAMQIVGFDPSQAFYIQPQIIADNLASGKWKAQPQIMKLSRGVPVIGFLEGPGPDAEVQDPRTKELKPVGTWILRSLSNSGVRVSILTSAQLDKKLAGYVGHPEGVSICRLEEVDTASGGRVTQYIVCGAAEVVERELADAAKAAASAA